MKTFPHILRIWLSALFLLAYVAVAYTQTYPVQVYTQLLPPYTPHVPAYYTGTQEKLKLTLINTDMQQPLLNVYLRMKIISSSFSIINPPEVFTPAMQLPAGVNIQLSLSDLAVYFRSENVRLSGNQAEFNRTQLLPDNFYRFHFEVYEAATNKLLSNPNMGFAQAMIASGEPPVLNLPEKGTIINESPLPSIFFSWTPRHLNSVAAAYGTEYEISLVEIYDKTTPPENAFLYSRLLYTETVRPTSFIHSAAQPMLIPGMRYAWRVRAVSREGVSEVSVIKNNGYSPIYYFDYAADCRTVQIMAAVYENGHVNITWQDVGAMEYTVEYRKKGSQKWAEGRIASLGLCTLYNLQFNQEYEYRIGTRCVMNDVFQFGAIKSFRTPGRDEKPPSCGLMPDVSLTNQTPVASLVPGLPFLAGDFEVFVTRVNASSPFTGEGYVGIPYLNNAQVAVTFNNIVVNTDLQLVSGYVETRFDLANNNMLFDVDKALTGGQGVGDIRTGEERAAFNVDYTINPNIKALPVKTDDSQDNISESGNYTFSKGENGTYELILTDDEGKEHKLESETIPFTIKDKNGDTFEISETGEVKPISSSGSDIKLDDATKEVQSDLAKVAFEATPNTKYAIDPYRDVYAKVTEFLQKYKESNKDMAASAKFMLPGVSDEIFVRVIESKEGFDPAKVHFVTDKGQEYKGVYDAAKNGWTVNLAGSAAGDGQHLYVVHEVGKGNATLARLNIYTYEPKTVKIKLIPVNGFTNGFTAGNVSSQLNAIYQKVGITCEVEVAPSFGYTFANGTFNVTGSGLFSTLTDDMKALNAAYQQAHPGEESLCLFIIENTTGTDGIAGDMPRGKQFGYLFQGSTAQTIAHEIGHGLFHLDHPFDRANASKSFDKGDLADNLMEYSGGTNLVKLQWDAIHAPGLVIGLFERDEQGMAAQSGAETILRKIFETLKANGENACAFVRKQDSKSSNTETNTTVTETTIDYLIGKYEDEKVSFNIALEKQTGIELSVGIQLLVKNEHKEWILHVANGQVFICEATGNYSAFTSLKEAKDNATFLSTYKADLLSCKNSASNDLLATLQKLQSFARQDQAIELLFNGTTYALQDGKLQVVTTSSEDINSGNWTDDGIDLKIRFVFDSDGILQIDALGIRKYLPIASGKTASLTEIAQNMLLKGNSFLKEYKVNEAALTPAAINARWDGETFPDGKRVTIDNNASFVKILCETASVATSLLKTAEIEQPVYLENQENTIKIPPVATGSTEAAVRAVTDITSMVIFAYDVVVDKSARQEAIDGFKSIKDQVADDPSALFPLLRDALLEELTGSTIEQYDEIMSEQTDNGRQQHLISKTTVRTAVTVFASGKFLAKLPDMALDISNTLAKVKKLKNIVNTRNTIRKVLDTDAGKAYAKKYFDNIVKEGNFDAWYNDTFKKFDLGEPVNFEVHHVVPINVFQKNPKLQELLIKYQDEFEFNSIDNGIPLQKKSLKFDQAGHTNHPQYDDAVTKRVTEIMENPRLDDMSKFEEIKELINSIKNKLETDVLLGNMDVNQIINF